MGFMFVFVVGVVFAQSSSQRATQSASDPIRITSLNDGRFRFAQRATQLVYNFQADLSGCAGTLYDGATGEKYGGSVRARVLDETNRGKLWYVVMQVTTNSGCNVQGMCGAGVSVDVIWLKFDATLKLFKKQAVMVEDCRSSTELTRFDGKSVDGQDTALEMRNGVLNLQSSRNDYDKKTTSVLSLRYDRRTPERGFVISKKTVPTK
jgi:hypothetical protein